MPSPTKPEASPEIPADGVEFELTLAKVPDAIEMVRSDGYNPRGWKYKGKGTAMGTRRFKLARIGHYADLEEVKQKLGSYTLEGQWREAFKQSFPRSDGQGAIGFADDSWGGPDGHTVFPVLYGLGRTWNSSFDWAGSPSRRRWRWRWLVPCR
mgnify:CR=1 FL=1